MSPRQFYKPKNTKTMQAQKSEIQLTKNFTRGIDVQILLHAPV